MITLATMHCRTLGLNLIVPILANSGLLFFRRCKHNRSLLERTQGAHDGNDEELSSHEHHGEATPTVRVSSETYDHIYGRRDSSDHFENTGLDVGRWDRGISDRAI